MSKVLIDLDDEALADAATIFGTASKEETVNYALREVAARVHRAEGLAELVEIAKTGQFDILFDKRSRSWPR